MEIFKNLSSKDKVTLRRGGLALAFVIFIALILLPLQDSEKFYRDLIERKEKSSREIYQISARLKELKGRFAGIKEKSRGESGSFTLFSFLDKTASEAGLKERIKGMKPSIQTKDDYTESTVAVELEDVEIEPLVVFIHKVETSGHSLKIRKADIKPRYSSPDKMNVTLIISAIEMQG